MKACRARRGVCLFQLSHRFRPDSSQGFTLLELIISLTIVAVILVIVFGAFRVGSRAWEKGERDIERHQRYRIVLNLINRQMSSLNLRKVKKDNKLRPLIEGDANRFEFISNVSLIPANEFGLVYVIYKVEEAEGGGERLLLFEKNIIYFNEESDFEKVDNDDFIELIPDAESISFEYLKELDMEDMREWKDIWDPENDTGVPLAIRLKIVQDPESAPIEMIAPIYQETGDEKKT